MPMGPLPRTIADPMAITARAANKVFTDFMTHLDLFPEDSLHRTLLQCYFSTRM
jgi:hypothetical protein